MLKSDINSVVALLLVGMVSVSAWLVIRDAAYGDNPLSDLLLRTIVAPEY